MAIHQATQDSLKEVLVEHQGNNHAATWLPVTGGAAMGDYIRDPAYHPQHDSSTIQAPLDDAGYRLHYHQKANADVVWSFGCMGLVSW